MSAQRPKRNTRLYWRHVVFSLLVIAGASAITMGLIALVDFIKTTQTGAVVPTDEVVITDTEVSEKRPAQNQNYTVPADQPRRMSMPSVETEAYIQKVGITEENIMAAPNNIFFGGWYVNSVRPGQPGVSIINGHAGGRYERGVFHRLKELKPRDTIDIQMGDLSWKSFTVQSVETYSKEDAAAPLYADDPSIDKELHLITCDGIFDDASGTYDKRVIVVAALVGSGR